MFPRHSPFLPLVGETESPTQNSRDWLSHYVADNDNATVFTLFGIAFLDVNIQMYIYINYI